MAGNQLAPAEFPPQEQYKSAPSSADFLFLGAKLIEPGATEPRPDFPTNDSGIVIPPPIMKCIGKECKYKGEEQECLENRHHLHPTEDSYVEHSRLAAKFRDKKPLQVWLPECQHELGHARHALNVVVPEPEIMLTARQDSRKLIRVQAIYKELQHVAEMREAPDITLKGENGLRSKREELEEEREELFTIVTASTVLPEALVIGALLLAKPEYARQRIIGGAGVALSGVLSKEDLPEAKTRALSALGLAQAINPATELAEVV